MESTENIGNSATKADKVEVKSEKVEVKEIESNRGFTTKYVPLVCSQFPCNLYNYTVYTSSQPSLTRLALWQYLFPLSDPKLMMCS